MNRFRNILFFSNFDSAQDAAIQRAFVLAEDNDATLTLMSVLEAQSNTQHLQAANKELRQVQADIVQDHLNQLEKMANGRRSGATKVQVKVAIGIPFIEVIHEVLRARHDLVIMAADNKLGIVNRLFGSTSMHLMRKCPCPIWVVKPGRQSYQKILAAVDVTVDSWNVAEQSINPLILQLAGSMAAMNNSELHIVQVWSVYQEGYRQVRGNMSDQAIRRLRKDTKKDYMGKLEDIIRRVDTTGASRVRIHLKRGNEPARTITSLAKKQQIDLLVMGTVCRTGLAGFFIGNTAEEVLNAVDCSVLTVKPAAFLSPVTMDNQ